MAKQVLIVEDDAFLRDTIRLALQEHGVDVSTASDGEEAVHMIDKTQPDLLLLDLLMPKQDGFYVLKHIKEKEYGFPVVILSNLSGDMTPEKCIAIGAKDYLVKSDMDEEELWPRISKFL